MPYGHLIAATVMTLGVCQGQSSISSFSMLTSVSCSPSAIAQLLVCLVFTVFLLTGSSHTCHSTPSVSKVTTDSCSVVFPNACVTATYIIDFKLLYGQSLYYTIRFVSEFNLTTTDSELFARCFLADA